MRTWAPTWGSGRVGPSIALMLGGERWSAPSQAPRQPAARPAPGTVLAVRRTKIVATIGPASRDPETLPAMVEAGMDVARLNYSHGTLEEHAETARRVREAAGRAGRPVAILRTCPGRSCASARCATTSPS